MANDKRYYWIKLSEAFINSGTVDYIMEHPKGSEYYMIYQLICLKTVNTGGRLVREVGKLVLPYDEARITRDLRWFSAKTVGEAMSLFKSAGLVREDAEGVLVVADFDKLICSETDSAARMRSARASTVPIEPEKEASEGDKNECSQNVREMCEKCSQNVRTNFAQCAENVREMCAHSANTPKEKEKNQKKKKEDIDIETETDRESERKTATGGEEPPTPPPVPVPALARVPSCDDSHDCPFSEIMNLYHTICRSFPKIKAISGERRKAVKARWREYKSLDTFKELFGIAEGSAFMKGKNARNWSADFDWMMNAGNFSKILEHRYDQTRATAAVAQASDQEKSYDIDLFFKAATERRKP